MEDLGRTLLQSIGLAEDLITPAMIQAAIEANNAFIAHLEAIRDQLN
jgi:hypothetical protein